MAAQNPERRRRRRIASVLLLAASLAGAAVVFHRNRPQTTISLASSAVPSKRKVVKLLTNQDVRENIICDDLTFAYCGDATCNTLTNNTAACGCKIYRGRAAKFQLDTTTALLVASRTYRKAVMAVVDGDKHRATTLICDALDDGTLYKEAGFPTKYGSVSLEEDDAVLGSVADMSSCMGAPCSFTDSWNKDCDATCICPTTEADENTCVKNGCKATYWDDLRTLEDVIDAVADDFQEDGGGLVGDVADGKKCRALCTVHHKA